MKQCNNVTIKTIILAGGLGTRMAGGKPSPIPKALYSLGGKPMASYIIETLKKIGLIRPILVVTKKAPFKKQFADSCQYLIQSKPLGTGHAAKLAIEYIARNSKPVRVSPRSKSALVRDLLIVQGDDSAFYRPETLQKFIQNHEKTKATLSFLTTKIKDPSEFGRVIRNKRGEVIDLIEKEHLTPGQEKIKEINCGGYLMDLDWAKKNIKKIKKTIKKGKEYPLPDIIKIALNQGERVIAFPIESSEWIGINSPEQLKEAEKLMKKI